MNERIAAFKLRMETERDYCEELFAHATTRLMAHKYAYYRNSEHYIDDTAYDAEEESWRVMGRALGHLTEEETSPCVDFDEKHPYAAAGIALAGSLKPRKGD